MTELHSATVWSPSAVGRPPAQSCAPERALPRAPGWGHGIRDMECGTQDTAHGTWDTRHRMWDTGHNTRDTGHGTQDMGYRMWHTGHGTQDTVLLNFLRHLHMCHLLSVPKSGVGTCSCPLKWRGFISAAPQRLSLTAGRAAPIPEVPAQAALGSSWETTFLRIDLSHFSLCFCLGSEGSCLPTSLSF